tara:strand:- start:1235 stop:3622 length:2388 start_codon:yes stop_codon:yes gene_type:complete
MKQLRPYQKDTLDALLNQLKEGVEPVVVSASVGAGKSLIIAELLLHIERNGHRALCLTLNSELIRQNVAAYKEQGGHASIFCAALKEKDLSCPVVFASPNSIHLALKKNKELQKIRFNLVVIDECHNVNTNDKKSMYIRLLNHYGLLAQQEQYYFRVVGLTGTPYRGKGHDIVGDNCYFKKAVGNITTAWLIENHFLVEPYWGKPHELAYDFHDLKVLPNGQFNKKQLGELVEQQVRLTGNIMKEVSHIAKKRSGVFIFASTRRHCQECYDSLPHELTAIITGDTPHKEREEIINKARKGELKFLVNVNVLTVGVDVPNFDTIVFVRPTESLVLYTQAIGRGLRLNDNKTNCLVLDYAGNLDRHGNIDHPIINKALNDWAKNDDDYCIPCSDCHTMNKVTTRRCIGLNERKRCEKYFEWKTCPKCQTLNDRVARECRKCHIELVDPNAKLEHVVSELESFYYNVLDAKFTLQNFGDTKEARYRLLATYSCVPNDSSPSNFTKRSIQETFVFSSVEARKYFYYKFLKDHHPSPGKLYPHIHDIEFITNLIGITEFKIPSSVECVRFQGAVKIKNKFFDEDVSFREDFEDKIVEVVHIDFQPQSDPGKLLLKYICVDEKIGYFKTETLYNLKNPLARSKFVRDFPNIEPSIMNLNYKELSIPIACCSDRLDWPAKIVVDAMYQYKSIDYEAGTQNKNPRFDHVLKDDLYDAKFEIYDYERDKERPSVYKFELYGQVPVGDQRHRRLKATQKLSKEEADLVQHKLVKNVDVFKWGHSIFRIQEFHLVDGTSVKLQFAT